MKDALHTNLGNIIYIYQVLKKYSDVDHILSIKDIIKYVKEEFDEEIEDRTVSEIKMLTDLLHYSKFMEKSFSNEIAEKLKYLLSKYEQETINETEKIELYSKNIKTINKDVLNNIEVLSNSIKSKTKVEFEYYRYDINKKLKLEKTKRVSPYAILCENEFYYLIAYNEKFNELSYFRLDRIKNIKSTEIPNVRTKQSIKDFVQSSVYMFGGERQEIKLKCDMLILDAVIEKFGMGTEIQKIDEHHFKATLNVCPKGLKMWIMQYLNYVEILEPISMKEELKNNLKEILNKRRKKLKMDGLKIINKNELADKKLKYLSIECSNGDMAFVEKDAVKKFEINKIYEMKKMIE